MMIETVGRRPKRGAALVLTMFGLLAYGCDLQPIGPEASLAGEGADAILTPAEAANVSEELRLTVGDSVPLGGLAPEAGGSAPSDAQLLKVEFGTEGIYIWVRVPSSQEFDATQIDDGSVSLGVEGSVRLPIARRTNGTLIKVVGGGKFRPVTYYFTARDLNPGGAVPSFASLVLAARHPSHGAVTGNLTGAVAPAAPIEGSWKSSAPNVVSVHSGSMAIARSAGHAVLTFDRGGSVERTLRIEVITGANEAQRPEAPIPPMQGGGDLVHFPSPEVAAIIGPQLRAGSSANPWSWFDQNATAHSDKLWGNGSWSDRANGYYYDHALTQYINYYRTGNATYLSRARQAADLWYDSSLSTAYSPREAALAGLMLRALDGKPEYWDFITKEVERHFSTWVGRRIGYSSLYYGVRDGGYSLLYAAQLAAVHPDPAVRSDMLQKAHDGAIRYYVPLQSADGGWYWVDPDLGKGEPWEQPFQVGLLLEGMIAVHQLTGDAAVERSILRSVEHLYTTYRKDEKLTEAAAKGAAWRSVPYFYYPDGRFSAESALDGGWDTNTIREGRQRNTLILHAFGYAYHLTRDAKYRSWGDEIFAASYGKGQGPLTDPFYSLADFRGKEYNQAYRTAGRYLAWRLD